jgi:hypothetical protein
VKAVLLRATNMAPSPITALSDASTVARVVESN